DGQLPDLHSFPTRRSSDLGAVAGGGDPGDVRRGGAPGSEGTEALGGSGGWQSSADYSSPATGEGAEHPADHRRRLYPCGAVCVEDRKSTRLNSSHSQISYA